jgi:hypothetical protein
MNFVSAYLHVEGCAKIPHMRQNNKMHKCLTTSETQIVLKELHEGMAKGHFVTNIIVKKILDARYWWPTLFMDIHDFC